ncbi:MAG: hypothetical protein LH702_15240 [Phormidesmis sp. CAN_BIN44]|nr:hypothetical protein [Phormidesmis sp. CAN_BIN44]
MKVKGIKRGQIIELIEVLDVPDGEQVTVEVSRVHPLSQLTPKERQMRIDSALGGWKNDPNLDNIFAEIDRERHADRGRQIDSFDD